MVDEANELMRMHKPEAYLKAYQIYAHLLNKEPRSEDIKLKMAHASVCYMRSMTNANAVKIDGTSDTPENRKLWREHGPQAYKILQQLHKIHRNDADLHIMMVEAFMYTTSSKGILKAALHGDGFAFLKYVSELVEKYPSHDAGVSHIYEGAFYLAAPWPLKDIKRARVCFERSLKVEPRSLRNNYFAGVGAWSDEDYEAAVMYFTFATEHAESVAKTEKDVAAFFRREALRGLGAATYRLHALAHG